MAFPCPLCGAVSRVRTSRMLSATTKETYYNCSNHDCCHQYKTTEGDPLTVACPIPGGQAIPERQQRTLKGLKTPPIPALTRTPEGVVHRVGR